MVTTFLAEAASAFQRLVRKKLFSGSVVLCIGLAIGALLCFLSLATLIFFRPLPYPDSERLYIVKQSFTNGGADMFDGMSAYPSLMLLYKHHDVFEKVGMAEYAQQPLHSHRSMPLLNTSYVTPEYNQLLGMRTELGRSFDESERVDSHQSVAILSHKAWSTYFGKSPDVIGTKLSVAGRTYAVIGVADASFREPEIFYTGHQTDIWFPWDFNPSDQEVRSSWEIMKGDRYLLGKVPNDVDLNRANQKLTALLANEWDANITGDSFFAEFDPKARLVNLREVVVGGAGLITNLLLMASFLLLLIVLINVVNIYIAYSAEQSKNTSVHLSIGARTRDIFLMFVAESSWLLGLAMLFGVTVANVGFLVLNTQFSSIFPRLNEVSLAFSDYAFAVAVSICLALLIAFIRLKFIDLTAFGVALKTGGKGTGAQVPKRLRGAVIASQVTFSTVFLFGNLLLFKAAYSLISYPIGFSTDSTYYFNISTETSLSTQSEDAAKVNGDEIHRRLSNLPSAQSVTRSSNPFAFHRVVPVNEASSGVKYGPLAIGIDHGYFGTLSQNVLRGRSFESSDSAFGNKVAIINEEFASELSKHGDALGLSLIIGEDRYKIVGVVNNTVTPDTGAMEAKLYLPELGSALEFVVRMEPSSVLEKETVASLVRSVNGALSINEFESLDTSHKTLLTRQYLAAGTTSFFSMLALVVSGLGLYGIVSYGVQLRLFEFGCRLCVGARFKDLPVLVVRENIGSVLAGMVGAAVLAIVVCHFLRAHLPVYSVGELIATFATAVVFMLMACLLALLVALSRIWNKTPNALLSAS